MYLYPKIHRWRTSLQFRKPALYFKLPSNGNFYPENSLDLLPNGEIPVFPTTALDDITIKTVDALFNGVAITELIKSCAPSIKEPWNMPIIDLDPLLVAIKLASFGNTMDIESPCPECEETGKYGLSLTGILGELKPGNYNTELWLNGISVKFKPLSYSDYNRFNIQEFEFQKVINSLDAIKDPEQKSKKQDEIILFSLEMQIDRIVGSIEYIRVGITTVTDKSHIKEFLFNCSTHDFQKVKNTYASLKSSTQTKPLKIKCVHCSHEYEQPLILNYCEYFRSRLLYMAPDDIQKWIEQMEKETEDIKSGALKMSWYMRGGITFNEILMLSEKEREVINEIIKENLETTKKTQMPFF